jgi:5-methylcytosine-specific restriction endonuclease McrA
MTSQKHDPGWNSPAARAEFQEMVNLFGGLCVRCGSNDGVLRDHIIPKYQGGPDHITNLQPLCSRCNTSKGPEDIDHRIAFAEEHGLTMPSRWIP